MGWIANIREAHSEVHNKNRKWFTTTKYNSPQKVCEPPGWTGDRLTPFHQSRPKTCTIRRAGRNVYGTKPEAHFEGEKILGRKSPDAVFSPRKPRKRKDEQQPPAS
jgi:hypothetical protein